MRLRQDRVDDVDDAIGGLDVIHHQLGGIDEELAAYGVDANIVPVQSGDERRGHDIVRRQWAAYYMVEEEPAFISVSFCVFLNT